MKRGDSLRDLGLYLRGQLNTRLSRALNARDRTPRVVPPPLDEVIHGGRTPLALSRLLEGRSNAERESAVARYLNARGVPFALHPFASLEAAREFIGRFVHWYNSTCMATSAS